MAKPIFLKDAEIGQRYTSIHRFGVIEIVAKYDDDTSEAERNAAFARGFRKGSNCIEILVYCNTQEPVRSRGHEYDIVIDDPSFVAKEFDRVRKGTDGTRNTENATRVAIKKDKGFSISDLVSQILRKHTTKAEAIAELEIALAEFYPEEGQARKWARAWFSNHCSKKDEFRHLKNT